MNHVVFISGQSNPNLSERIFERLSGGFPNRPVEAECILDNFANGEVRVELLSNVLKKDVVIVQTGISVNGRSINDHLVELMALIDACKRSNANTVTVIMPFYPYSRSDKKDRPGLPIMAKVIINVMQKQNIDRLITMDLHSGQIQGFADFPLDNLYAIDVFLEYFDEYLFATDGKDKYCLVSPDQGSIKRIKDYAERLQMSYVILNKDRDYTKPNTVMKSTLTGDPSHINGKIGIIIDDMIDTMSTATAAARVICDEHDALSAIIVATHGILSRPAIERINECESIERVIVTNTIDQQTHMVECSKLVTVDVAGLFSTLIQSIME